MLAKSSHRGSFVGILANDILARAADENLPAHTAATRVLLEWLGYELDTISFIDGQDRGIDAWLSSEGSFDIFQVKTHQFTTDGALDLSSFDGEGVRDLERAKTFLTQERPANVANKRLKQLLQQWDSAIRSQQLSGDNASLLVQRVVNRSVVSRRAACPGRSTCRAGPWSDCSRR